MATNNELDGNPKPSSCPSAVLTVVRDPNHCLGKRFEISADGSIKKSSKVHLSFGIAVQHHVPSHAELAALLYEVGNDPNAAIINAGFVGIGIGEEFAILSEREIEKRLGLPATDRSQQKGIHTLEYNGKHLKAVGRFKENVSPSNWQLLDRDVDQHTPNKYASLTTEAWLLALTPIVPGIDKVSYVETPSTSSRVHHDGKVVGQGNGHIWMYVSEPADIERFRTALIVRAAEAEMTWHKPRFSRTDESKIIGKSLTTIVDPSVLTPGRLVFDGKPTVGRELSVAPMTTTIHRGEYDALDTTIASLPSQVEIREITRKAGVEMSVRINGTGLSVSAKNLTLNTEIETKIHGILTIRELVKRGVQEKIRCQTPFRASESWAAFYNINPDGIPFVFDSGTSTTHWLNEFEAEEVKTIPAQAVVEQLIPKVREDAAVVLEDVAINALATIKQHKPANFQRARNALKLANKQVSLTAVDRSVKVRIEEINTVETHHGYAKSILSELTEDSWAPHGYQGDLYVVNATTGLWERKPIEALIRLVAERHDAKEHCSRSSDYRAIGTCQKFCV